MKGNRPDQILVPGANENECRYWIFFRRDVILSPTDHVRRCKIDIGLLMLTPLKVSFRELKIWCQSHNLVRVSIVTVSSIHHEGHCHRSPLPPRCRCCRQASALGKGSLTKIRRACFSIRSIVFSSSPSYVTA
jgi:hypothetical protein